MELSDKLRQAFQTCSLVLSMPNPVDAQSAMSFARWVDHTLGLGAHFAADDPTDDADIASMVDRAQTELKDTGFIIFTENHTLWVFSPVPAGAPATIEDLASRIDEQQARFAVSLIMAVLGAADGWNGDIASMVADIVKPIVRDMPSLPPIDSADVGIGRYWESLTDS